MVFSLRQQFTIKMSLQNKIHEQKNRLLRKFMLLRNTNYSIDFSLSKKFVIEDLYNLPRPKKIIKRTGSTFVKSLPVKKIENINKSFIQESCIKNKQEPEFNFIVHSYSVSKSSTSTNISNPLFSKKPSSASNKLAKRIVYSSIKTN